jgi:hypothetical protein
MGSPINMNQSVMQSVISERVQQVQQQHPEMQQRYFDQELAQERIKKQHKVNDFEETSNIKLQNNEERKQRRDRRKSKDDEKPIPQTETAYIPDSPPRIDIKA